MTAGSPLALLLAAARCRTMNGQGRWRWLLVAAFLAVLSGTQAAAAEGGITGGLGSVTVSGVEPPVPLHP